MRLISYLDLASILRLALPLLVASAWIDGEYRPMRDSFKAWETDSDIAFLAALGLRSASGSAAPLDSITWKMLPEGTEVDSDSLIAFLTRAQKPLRCIGTNLGGIIQVDCRLETTTSELELHAILVAKIAGTLSRLFDSTDAEPYVDIRASGETLPIRLSVFVDFLREYRIDSLAIGIQPPRGTSSNQSVVLSSTRNVGNQ
jgi:hypothetical protein